MGDAVAVLALLLASSAQIKPHAPLPRPDDSIIAVRQGCRVEVIGRLRRRADQGSYVVEWTLHVRGLMRSAAPSFWRRAGSFRSRPSFSRRPR